MGQSQPINRFPVLIEDLSALGILSSKETAIIDRLRTAQAKAFEQSGQDSDGYLSWLMAWSLDQDPVAYGFDMMEQAERQRYVNSLSHDERSRFVASLDTAHRLGICSPPGWNSSNHKAPPLPTNLVTHGPLF